MYSIWRPKKQLFSTPRKVSDRILVPSSTFRRSRSMPPGSGEPRNHRRQTTGNACIPGQKHGDPPGKQRRGEEEVGVPSLGTSCVSSSTCRPRRQRREVERRRPNWAGQLWIPAPTTPRAPIMGIGKSVASARGSAGALCFGRECRSG